MEDYLRATEILTSHTRGKGPKERRAKLYTYVLAGRVHCPLCRRKMISHAIPRRAPYYCCRYAEEYALANKITHPRNIFLREKTSSLSSTSGSPCNSHLGTAKPPSTGSTPRSA